jgi:hypothetical protein
MGVKISTITIETRMDIPQIAKDRTAIWSSYTSPGQLPKIT